MRFVLRSAPGLRIYIGRKHYYKKLRLEANGQGNRPVLLSERGEPRFWIQMLPAAQNDRRRTSRLR